MKTEIEKNLAAPSSSLWKENKENGNGPLITIWKLTVRAA